MLSLLLMATAPVTWKPQVWFGPARVSAQIPFTGNPYDPQENDIRVEFTGDRGEKTERLAFYTADGQFAAILVANKAGRYRVRYIQNGKPLGVAVAPVRVETKLSRGFLRLKGNRFAWSDGTPYFPIGYNYAWRAVKDESVPEGIKKMGEQGANWTRIWANSWDGKNPVYPDKPVTVPARQLWQDALSQWDTIIAVSEKSDVNFQFVLFHHGLFSTTTNPNWGDHPWNTTKGGFLSDPADFFANQEAKRRTKIWLRYAVARYGHSPSIMAWELFNEVQWVDAARKKAEHLPEVIAWHKEMGDYLRSIDPYHHLVTSSSNEGLDPRVFAAMDYDQPHTYPANVLAAIGGVTFKDKPGFFGEFGPPGAANSPEYRRGVRDGIYGGILAGHAGAGMYWFWDEVTKNNLGTEFTAARKIIDQSGLKSHENASPLSLVAETPKSGDLTLSPGAGWAKSLTTEFNLPNVDAKSLGGWSPYFQSLDGGNKSWASPLVIRFKAKLAGKAVIRLSEVSAGGATFAVSVNGVAVADQKFAGGSRKRVTIEVPYPAGAVEIRAENHGADWVHLDSVTVPGLSPTAYAHGIGESNWALVRVFGTDTSSVSLSGLSLKTGKYKVRLFDTATGASSERILEVREGRCQLANLPADSVLDFKK